MPDLPTMRTCPPDSTTGAVEPRSRSVSLSSAHVVGAKWSTSFSVGESPRTLSPSSYVVVDAPLPVAARISPDGSTLTPAGAQMAPPLAVGTP